MPLVEVKADVEKNRLYMKLIGLPTPAKAHGLLYRLKVELSKLKPGFTLLNDSRMLMLKEGDVPEIIAEIMQEIAARKPSKVVRVVNEVAGVPLAKISSEVGYQAAVFNTVKKAEEFLDN